jgi:hypothetical protein
MHAAFGVWPAGVEGSHHQCEQWQFEAHSKFTRDEKWQQASADGVFAQKCNLSARGGVFAQAVCFAKAD